MKITTKRTIIRTLHLVLAIPIIGYIYSPFEMIPDYAFPTRFIFMPMIALSGLWMWKGHLIRQILAKKPRQTS